MIYTASDNYRIIDFDTKKSVVGARQIDDKNLTIELYNYQTEILETKNITTFGLDSETRTIYIRF